MKHYFIYAEARKFAKKESQKEFKQSILALHGKVVDEKKVERLQKQLTRKQNRLNGKFESEDIKITFEENKKGEIVLIGFYPASLKFIPAKIEQ